MKLTGAQALIRSLEEERVDIVFGIPGGVLLPIYDALYHSEKITHVLCRHEQVAAHAADGYARATGRVGVCIATSGPGATNLVTGIANAYMDSVPMVAITGQVPTPVIGTDAFQEADTTGITLPIVKHSYLVKDAADLPRVVKEAFYIASTGRPGPVVIDVPKDVSLATISFAYPKSVNLQGYKPTYKGHAKQIKNATAAILESERPVIYCGGGIVASGASAEVQRLAELGQIPVTTTLMGIGVIPGDHQLSLGMLGMHGTRYANYAISDTDLVVALGVRFDDRVTGKLESFAKGAKVIHADIDPAEIGKNVPARIPIVGDARTVLAALNEDLESKLSAGKAVDHGAWLQQIEDWRRDWPLGYPANGTLQPGHIVERISELTADRQTVVTTGVGQNQMWAAQFYRPRRPRSFLSSGGLGTMGYGLPAAIGAQFGQPESTVFLIDGDGSFQMVLQDLATVAMNRLPIKMAVLNNGYLGMVRQWQELFHDRHYSASCLMKDHTCPPDCSAPKEECPVYVPDFVKLAEAYGIIGLRVGSPEAVDSAITEALENPGPVLIDFLIDREANVYPMVPAGAAISEMIGGDEK